MTVIDNLSTQLRRLAFKMIHLTTIILPAWRETLQGMGMTVRLMPHDVPTRWNSSTDMVEFALEYHEPINVMTQKRDLGLRNLELSDEEWGVLRELHAVLKVWTCQSLKVIKTEINKIPTDSE